MELFSASGVVDTLHRIEGITRKVVYNRIPEQNLKERNTEDQTWTEMLVSTRQQDNQRVSTMATSQKKNGA